jgi:hypothetical protein
MSGKRAGRDASTFDVGHRQDHGRHHLQQQVTIEEVIRASFS